MRYDILCIGPLQVSPARINKILEPNDRMEFRVTMTGSLEEADRYFFEAKLCLLIVDIRVPGIHEHLAAMKNDIETLLYPLITPLIKTFLFIDDMVNEISKLHEKAIRDFILVDLIKGFSSLTQHMAPRDVIITLNTVFDVATRIIHESGGDIDKFIGDAFFAVYTDADAAVQSMVRLQRELKALNARRVAENKSTVMFRIGIHAGRKEKGRGEIKYMHLTAVHIDQHKFPTREHYPFSLPVIQQTRTIPLSSPITFFVGENGSGKSTLLDAISHCCRIYIWQGDLRTRSVYNPYEGALYRCLSVAWQDGIVPGSFFSAELFKNFSRIVDEWASTDPGVLGYFGGKSLLLQSHGQSIMAFFRSRFFKKGLYLLDEPEAALSPKTQLALLEVLSAASQTGEAQFIIATHSPILLACPEAEIYSFDHIPVTPVAYKETEHYRIYKEFMENPSVKS